jgi:hypothetical protein
MSLTMRDADPAFALLGFDLRLDGVERVRRVDVD